MTTEPSRPIPRRSDPWKIPSSDGLRFQRSGRRPKSRGPGATATEQNRPQHGYFHRQQRAIRSHVDAGGRRSGLGQNPARPGTTRRFSILRQEQGGKPHERRPSRSGHRQAVAPPPTQATHRHPQPLLKLRRLPFLHSAMPSLNKIYNGRRRKEPYRQPRQYKAAVNAAADDTAKSKIYDENRELIGKSHIEYFENLRDDQKQRICNSFNVRQLIATQPAQATPSVNNASTYSKPPKVAPPSNLGNLMVGDAPGGAPITQASAQSGYPSDKYKADCAKLPGPPRHIDIRPGRFFSRISERRSP